MDCGRLFEEATIVLPTLNEAEAIGLVIDELLNAGVPVERILVVDGYSSDGTVEIARGRGVRVVFQEGVGKAAAVKTALRYVDTPFVVFMDGDYTYPGSRVCDLLVWLKEGYDHVVGARVWDKRSQSLVYRIGNRALTLLFNALFGVKLTDVLSGMYASRTRVLREVDFEMHGFSVESEIAAHMAATGRRIKETPVEYRRRLGEKKLGVKHGFKIALDMVRLTWRYNPAFLIFALGSLLLLPGLLLGAHVGYHYFFTGVKYHVKGLVAIALALTGFISSLLAVLALYVKRMEIRLLRKIEELRGREA
ncbi:MAG: glycosyltransferase family 2 protein [Desulfurococcus sp.]|nr:glycosyltransferase family 2 protein [Desulfurococcus sp.]